MQSPSQLLRYIPKSETSKSLSSLYAYWKSSSGEYDKLKLDEARPLLVEEVNVTDSAIKSAALDLINKHQVYINLELERYRIVPVLHYRNEQRQLPQPPTSLNELAGYALRLASMPDFELTKNNRIVKANLLSSLEEGITSGDKSLIKSILLNEIITVPAASRNKIRDYFGMLDYDTDTHYLLCLMFFVNPYRLDRIDRINQVLEILAEFKSKQGDNYAINVQDWEFLLRLTRTNLCTFDTHYHSSFPFSFSKLITLITDVNSCYLKFDLVGMLRFLRNAESGYENPCRDPDTQKSEVVRFNINYLRFLILERAIMEWNRDSLTDKTWDQYNFSRQWKTVWDMYYDNDQTNLSPPGGPTIQSHVKRIVGL